MNKHFKLPLKFDIDRLLEDLALCDNYQWNEHFNSHDFSGQWTSISLRSASGKENDIYAHTAPNFIDTALLSKCVYFSEILNKMQFEKETVRLLCLAPGSEIKEHSDKHLGYEFGSFRLHIPITSDENVLFIVDGQNLKMKPGECWYANFHLPHSVRHNGSVSRIHLVIDGKRNAWTDELFARAGYDFEFEKNAGKPSPETLRLMIAELSHQDNEAAKKLKRELEQELASK